MGNESQICDICSYPITLKNGTHCPYCAEYFKYIDKYYFVINMHGNNIRGYIFSKTLILRANYVKTLVERDGKIYKMKIPSSSYGSTKISKAGDILCFMINNNLPIDLYVEIFPVAYNFSQACENLNYPKVEWLN